jgi:hypothetical protein
MSNERTFAMTDEIVEWPNSAPGNRQIRSLPRFKKSTAFYAYRSVTNAASDDDISGDEYDTDVGTALSDIEGDLDSFSRCPSVDMDDDDEGQQVDSSIPALPWSEKGKDVDAREYGDKKRKMYQETDGDADDEFEVSEVVTKKVRMRAPVSLPLNTSPALNKSHVYTSRSPI